MTLTKYKNIKRIILIFYIAKQCLYIKEENIYYSFFFLKNCRGPPLRFFSSKLIIYKFEKLVFQFFLYKNIAFEQ